MTNKIKYKYIVYTFLFLILHVNSNAQDALTVTYNCSTGCVDLTINGGYAPYEVEWHYTRKGINWTTISTKSNLDGNDGQEDYCSPVYGTYKAVVHDYLCGIAEVTILVDPCTCITIEEISHKNVSQCGGNDPDVYPPPPSWESCDGMLSVAVTGTNNYTINWSNGAQTPSISDLCTGTYTVSVTTGGCTKEKRFEICCCRPESSYTPTNKCGGTGAGQLSIDDYFLSAPSAPNANDGSIEITVSGGGQEIADADEETKGAVTVANKNDTDGDTLVDFQDNEVVSGPSGRDEVDLMKLVVRKFGKFPISCTELLLKIEGKAKIWNYKTKMSEAINTFDIQNMASETILWVEAYETSNTVRDISITAIGKYDNGEGEKEFIFDKVNATAIWVEKREAYTRNGIRQIDPQPSILGIDEVNVVNLINYFGEADDNSRYGFGDFDPNDFYYPPNVTRPRFGGRILFEFELMPMGVEKELSNLGIIYDISRRIARNNSFVKYNGTTITYEEKNFPEQKELSNDDTANTDEDLLPKLREIFSYDAPSEETQISSRSFSVRNLDFEEFVRVSFGEPITGNAVVGSRYSDSFIWELKYGLKTGTSNTADPYDANYHILQQTTGGTQMVSLPRRLAGLGNGNMNIIGSGTVTILTYLLELSTSGDKWFLKNRMNNNILGTSNISPTGPWSIISSSISVSITQGSVPFSEGALFIFNVWNMPLVPNTLKAN